MMKYFYYILELCFCITLFSCGFSIGDDKVSAEDDSTMVDSMGLEKLDLYTEAVIPESADELFDDFLYSYISSEKFNKERTKKGVDALELNENENFIVIYEREKDLLLQKDTTLSSVHVEKIEWGSDLIRKYDFNRNKGKWFLTAETEDEISNTPNASFLVFLNDFITDSLFQHESLKLPLSFKYYSEEENAVVQSSLSYDEWKSLMADLPNLKDYAINIDYGQLLISTSRKSLLLKGLSNGLFMKFHFDFSDGKWVLIEVES